MSALSRMSPVDREAMERLAEETGYSSEDLAAEMAASFLRLVLDAPAALPARPLTAIVQRVRHRSQRAASR